MTDSNDDWSPADHPYAIAISEAQWWMQAVYLAVLRLKGEDDERLTFSSRQIDARNLVLALRQLLAAEFLERQALNALDMDPRVRAALVRQRQKFEAALPGIRDMRDGLIHFESWSRGEGTFGPQKERREAGIAPRDIAREFWSFGFDPATGTVSFGPYAIDIEVAVTASYDLVQAIVDAARAIDRRAVESLRVRVMDVLTAGVEVANTAAGVLKVSSGGDLRLWLSIEIREGADAVAVRELAEEAITALATAQIRLIAPNQLDSAEVLERLVGGLVVQCKAHG